MAERFGKKKSFSFLKAHILTGWDMRIRLGTKAAALKAKPELCLDHFEEEPPSERALYQVEKYLLKVLGLKSTCDSFDKFWYKAYT